MPEEDRLAKAPNSCASAVAPGLRFKVGPVMRWTKSGGTTVSQSATTDPGGKAQFQTTGGRGTYTLTVNNVTKSGHTLDPANSVLSKSITK